MAVEVKLRMDSSTVETEVVRLAWSSTAETEIVRLAWSRYLE